MIVDIDDMHINIHQKLNTAVVQQNLDKVQKYLAQGADANYVRLFDDCPALIQAMKHTYDEDGCEYEPNIEIIKLLIENGADVNQTNEHKSTPLHYAVELKNKGTEIIKLLIDKGADVNAKDSAGNTPLHCAVSNSLENTKILIDNGADVNAKSRNGETPLNTARDYKDGLYTTNTESIFTAKKTLSLLETIQKSQIEASEKLIDASMNGDFDKVKECLKNGANIDYINDKAYIKEFIPTPLITAIKYGNNDIAKYLIEQGANVNIYSQRIDGKSPLMIATKCGNLKLVKLLIDNGARMNDMDWGNNTALDIAEFETDKIDKKTKEELKNLIISNGGERSEYSKYSEYKNYDEYKSMTKSLPTENEPKIKPKTKAKAKQKQKSNDFGMGM